MVVKFILLMIFVWLGIRFYQALIRNNIQAEMHLYPKGNHGFVLKIPTNEWMEPLFKWMKNY